MKRKRQLPPPLPANAIQAIVIREDRQLFAAFDNQKLPLTPKDAWNFDIHHELSVVITLDDEGAATIIRKKNNKRYVQI